MTLTQSHNYGHYGGTVGRNRCHFNHNHVVLIFVSQSRLLTENSKFLGTSSSIIRNKTDQILSSIIIITYVIWIHATVSDHIIGSKLILSIQKPWLNECMVSLLRGRLPRSSRISYHKAVSQRHITRTRTRHEGSYFGDMVMEPGGHCKNQIEVGNCTSILTTLQQCNQLPILQ